MDLPSGWTECCLKDIGTIVSGGTPATTIQSYFGGPHAWITPADLTGYTNAYISGGKRYLTDEGLKNSSAVLMPKGSVLFSSRAPIGYVAISLNDISTNQGFKSIVPHRDIYCKYIYYYLKNAKSSIESVASGTTFKEVSSGVFASVKFLLPPLAEQHRIVEKIDALFSELDKGVETLQTIKHQLKTYRQAVLKWAFEGKLTVEWRKSNQVESSQTVLNTITSIRSTEANRPNFESIHPEFESYSLPGEWQWVSLGYISKGVEYGTSSKSRKEGDVPVLRMGNIQNGAFSYADLVYTSDRCEIERYMLNHGDVLFNRTNSPELVGKTAIYTGTEQAIFAGYLIRINQLSYIDPRYLNYYLNSPYARICGNMIKTDGVNQSNINGTKLASYPFPLCSLDEQTAVVREIDSRLSVCDNLEQLIDENLAKAEALRQSILKKAFDGRLVPQDPNDEPAEKLLERVKAERATQTSPGRRRRNNA